jgi:large subunit ribosomal protein LP0
MPKDSVEARNKKKIIIRRCFDLFDKFNQIILVGFSNVGSNQVQQIRKLLAKKNGKLVIAKNTLLRMIVNLRAEPLDPSHEDYEMLKNYGAPKPELKSLLPHLKDKVGLIFTDEPVFDLKGKIEESKLATEAKVGAISPIDYVIPPGATGLDPSQINFFHALQISTKIEKAQIQITKDYKVCTVGKKVGNSEAALLKKLNLKPFFYGMVVLGAYDNGAILSK